MVITQCASRHALCVGRNILYCDPAELRGCVRGQERDLRGPDVGWGRPRPAAQAAPGGPHGAPDALRQGATGDVQVADDGLQLCHVRLSVLFLCASRFMAFSLLQVLPN
jgi:hypothetical protein